MDKEEFRLNNIEGRQQLLEKIIDTFKFLDPVAIHLFGSGSTGFRDEFSDIDIWITFKDSAIEDILSKLNNIFKSIAPILVRHHSKSWSPPGGSANSIIHETEFGLFIVDYYISKLSDTVIKEDALILYGDNSIKRGEWRLNKVVNINIRDTHTLRGDINLLIDLIFISIKGIIRRWEGDDFVNTLKIVHKNFRKRSGEKIKRRRIGLSFRFDYRLLSDLYPLASKGQRRAISKIRKYAKQVETLYK